MNTETLSQKQNKKRMSSCSIGSTSHLGAQEGAWHEVGCHKPEALACKALSQENNQLDAHAATHRTWEASRPEGAGLQSPTPTTRPSWALGENKEKWERQLVRLRGKCLRHALCLRLCQDGQTGTRAMCIRLISHMAAPGTTTGALHCGMGSCQVAWIYGWLPVA